jgi:serine/threonine protein kinase/Tfp pilus assembly protein PilF
MKCPKCDSENPTTSRFCAECGTRLPISSQEASQSETRSFKVIRGMIDSGATLAGKYHILEELGRGGMGRIYKAEDIKLKRTVAIKLLPADLTRDPEARQRFIQEAQAASALDHSSICTIFEIDETDDGQMFIAMAYYPGETLKEKIKRGPVKVDEAIGIAIQLAEGLLRAHEAGIIHRDVKPGNIIVTDRGDVRILDFGLAKLAGQTGLTRAGTMMGTVIYMSPEQARGDEVDHRSDVWSLGVVLYEMLTGQIPFKGEHDQTVIYSILNVDPKPVHHFQTHVPAKLERIVRKAMQKNPRDRYQTMHEIVEDLQGLRQEMKTSDATQISAVLGRDEDSTSIRVRKPVAVISFENLTGDSTYEYLRKAIPNLLITSLEQSKYIRVITWERMHDLLKQLGKYDVEVIDKDTGFEISRMEGVDSIVVGSFTKAGDIFATDVKVLDVDTKQLLKSASSRGEGIDSILRTQIDELSREISRGIGISERKIATEGPAPIADVTTSSMEAYDRFLEGREAYERLYNDDARRALEEAVALDPDFAVAYLYLAWIYGRLRETKSRNQAYEKAMQLSDRASKKEKMYIEASYADTMEQNLDKRFRILKQMAKEFPQEKRVHHLLASHYRVRKLFYQAIEEYNRVLELDPNYGWAMNELAYMYTDVEDYEKAYEYFTRYGALYPGDANPIDSMGELYFRMGKLDKAMSQYKEALKVRPDFYYAYWEVAYVYALMEDYTETMKWIDRFIERAPSVGTKAEGHQWKGFYLYWQGGLNDALDEAQKLHNLAVESGSELWKAEANRLRGWIYLEKGEFDRSRSCFEEGLAAIRDHESEFIPPQLSYSLYTPERIPTLVAAYVFAMGLADLKDGKIESARSRLAEMGGLLPHYSELLHAELLLVEGSYEKAITVCEKCHHGSIPYMSDTDGMLTYNLPPYKDIEARVYELKGDVGRAIGHYETLVRFDSDSRNRRLIHPKYHYRLARLCDKKGLKDKAIEQYNLFLDLMKRADPDLPDIVDARQRLASLREPS